jgi:hypothetical protein
VGSLVLIGCGSFDVAARQEPNARVAARLDDATRRRLSSYREFIIAAPWPDVTVVGCEVARFDLQLELPRDKR